MIFLAAVFILCASIKQHTISAVEDTACDCPSHLFSCGNCICIPKHWACDGDNDCGNHRDEASCDIIRRCPPGQFTCRNKRCIIKHWLCDDDNDCADDSDELDCPMRNCTKDEFQCDGVKCIPDKWRCDHDNDCEDGTDEKCDTKLSCNSKQFQCGNGLCIPKAWKCDKDIDCADGEDEKNCHKDELFCGMKEFQCLQAQKCIPLEKKCDWINDCGDFEDEIDCNFQPFNSHMTSCGRKEFKCGDGTCIRKDWQCDGDVDCNDQSDESNCTLPTCGKDEFTCLMGECIPGDKKCNGIFDCPDNSDEHNCTYSQSACGPSLFECDVKKCVHINDVCDGKDDCDDKTDETRCVLQDMLIYARRTYVERLFLDEGRSQIIPLMNIGHSIAIDFDPVEKRVYWSDGERHIIGSANLDGSDQKAILDKNISHPDGIAVDSVHRVIYWTDTGLNQISMANLDGTNRKTIINKDLDEPRDIAVDTVSGHIYWSDWGVKPRLERASLNGGDRFVIRNTSLKWPNGIGLDVKEKKLYWGDAHQNTIEEINFDGSGHKVLLTGVPHVFGTTVYGDSIYWTDLQTRTIERVNKNDIKDREVILEGLADLMDIKAVSVMRKMDLCLPVEYTCASGQCILKSQHCDGNIDCLDATDEIGCINSAKVCGLDQFTCYNSKCISNQKKCNGKDDCGDDSDERNCSFPPASCSDNSGGCDHICEQLPMGVHCSCYHGFKLQSDLKSCIDVDECNWMGTCSQQCVNTNGSFHCTCVEGYVLKPDGRGCKAKGGKAYLIFANRVDIRKVLPDLTEYDSILKGLENAIALDFDIMQGYVYWSDVTLDKIMRAFMNGSGKEEVVQYGLQSPAGLAVDWIHNVLYWTDSGTSVIEVMDLERKLRKILIWENLERPRAIVTHPGHGLLFWTDWGTIAKIERSGMDGSNRLVLANTSLFWPNGLTLDYATNKLYWADAKHHVIECANLDGTSRRTVINQGLPHPFALTLFEDELYWTDWRTRSINKANKFTGNDVEIIHNRLHFPMDIHSFHPQRQPKMRKRCLGSHRGCSHFCLPSPGPKSWTCSCPNGQHLLPDLKTCTSDMDTFLLYTTKTGIRRVNMDSSTKGKEVVILLAKVVMPVGLDFDAKHNMIYWTDTATDTISRAKIDGSHEEVLINTSLDMPARITLDWIGRKLYWAYPKRGLIEVSNLDGSYRKVLLWAKPYDIIVDPITGYIFWSDWSTPPTIDRAGMDGQGHITIVMDQLKLPNSLALDYIEERLYWMDSDLSHIESSDYEGKNRKIIITVDTNQQLSLLITVYQDKIYWTNHGVHSANKENGSGHLVLQKNTGNEHIMDIIMFHKNVTQAHTECSVNNGGCSHLCLIAPLPQSHSCACPTGVLMKEDGKTCNDEMVNFLIFARRTDIRKISLDVPYYESVVMPLKELRNVIALDVDYQRGKVYWTDTVLDKIMRANLDGSQKEVVITHGLDTPDGLAIDTIGKKIYWTDTDLKRIEVSNMEGTIRKVLIWKNLDKPRAIALAYEYGYLYFSDWGKEPRIERTGMDGQKRQLIISKNLGWPNSLVIDKSTSMLIWADAKMKVIECARLDGSSRRILVDKVKHPYGLTVFENSIYWTDWQWLGIFKADKLTGNNQTLVLRGLSGLMDIHAVQMRDLGRETLINKCQKNNGGCSHLCLPNPKGISCACPTGLRMKEDNKTCQRVPEKFLLFASRGSIRRISMDTKDQTDVVLPLEGLHNVIAVDYDLREKKIYYTDVHLDVIKKANFDGSDSDIILMKDLVTTDGLAVDWIGRNIFWTDAGQDQIEVAWLNGMCRKTLIKENLDQPRAIALDPAHGLMFWTDWGDNPKIERANMDGGYRIVIANSGLGFPNGLSVDYIAERLYWVDAKLDKIETADFRGGNRVRLLENILHPFGLTVYGDHIYWTDWQTEQIERANKRTGKERKVIQRHLEGPMDIEVVANDRQIGKNACSYKNGGCSHLCLATPHGRSCECPDIEDERPCQRVPTTDSSGLIPEYNAGLDKCTEERSSLGLCERQSQSSSSGTHGAMIALGLGIVVLAVIVAIITWRVRKRRQMNAYRVDNEEFVSLNFANPTYQKTSTETINLDRASSTGSQEWKIFRFNKKDQQVSILPSHRNRDTSNSERAMLIHQVDSNSVAHSKHVADKHTSSLFRSKSSQDSPPPKVPYQHVKT